MKVKTIAVNRKARFNYTVLMQIEAGIVLLGSEVKALRVNGCSIAESYISEHKGELWLQNTHIPKYKAANLVNHVPSRARKLLLHKREVNKLRGKSQNGNSTIIPLEIYFTNHGVVKVNIALAQGKKKYDKRETIKEREWNRTKNRLLKGQI